MVCVSVGVEVPPLTVSFPDHDPERHVLWHARLSFDATAFGELPHIVEASNPGNGE